MFIVKSNNGTGKYLYKTGNGTWSVTYNRVKAFEFTTKDEAEENKHFAGKKAVVIKTSKVVVRKFNKFGVIRENDIA